jgi:arylsulfatase A-like enzyme
MLLLAALGSECLASAAPLPRPNIIFILIDDARWDDFGCTGHPFSRTPNLDRIAREGLSFRNAFATTPLCSPSRASFLTGLYPHSHGITDNTDRSAASHRLATFPQSLQRAGYETAFLGKWHMGNDDSPRPGFTRWACLKGQGSTFDPELNVDGRAVKTSGYVTDILSARAVEFVRRPRSKPFLLYFAHKAMHPEATQAADGSVSDPGASNFIPAERHRNLYAGVKVPRRPNAADTLQGKPALQRKISGLPPLGPATGSSDAAILGRLRMLAAVDDSMGELLQALAATGQLDRTLIVVTSDHGYFYGEHGLSVERRLAYEEAIRIPLLLRYAPLIDAGGTRDQLVLSLDLAPTLLELAGAAALPGSLQGRSLVSLLGREGGRVHGVRDAFVVEHFSDNVFPRVAKMGYQALRTERWKLIHYVDLAGMDELYDLQSDPYEMKNLIGVPHAAGELRQLRAELSRHLRISGAALRN